MKQYCLICFLCWCSVFYTESALGQKADALRLKKHKDCVVYFASGNATLDAAAIQTLETFLQEIPISDDTRFRLQGFTDDVGSPTLNAALAKRRTTEVQEYLKTQTVLTEQIEIQAFQQLRLNPDKNIAIQRAENRRVVIEYWALPLKNDSSKAILNKPAFTIESFFNRNPVQFQQQFTINASEGAVIKGKKGTVLQIPMNCFVDQEGNIVNGKISFLLQEAYTYSDMLFQNLSTVSDGRLLETGGMLFIEAKDTAGNRLEIREGAAITAAMASTAASLPEMQTFNGIVDSSTNTVNWVATNQQVLSNNQGNLLWSGRMLEGEYSRYQKSLFNESLTGLKEVPVWNRKLPKEIDQPRFRKRIPKYPRLKIVEKPNKEVLSTKMPQTTNISDVNYKKKIRKKYVALQKKYRKKVQYNKKKKKDYRRDSIRYERALATHEKNVLKYRLYNDNMRIVLEEMYDHLTNFDLAEYLATYYQLHSFSRQFRQRNGRMSARKAYIKQEISSTTYDTTAVIQELQETLHNTSLRKFTEEEARLVEICWSDKLGKKILNYSAHWNFNPSKFRTNRYRVANMYNRVNSEGNLRPYQLRRIRTMKTIVKKLYNYNKLAKVDEELQRKQIKTLPLITRFCEKEKATLEMEQKFLEAKTKLNILTPSDVVDIYSNAMRIQNVGWINCDRFINQSNVMDLEIVTEHTQNTRVLVLFEGGFRALLEAFPMQENFKALRVPANRAIKLIGFRVVGDSMEVFVEEGTVKSLQGVKPVFKKKTVEEVEQMMQAI